MNTLEKTQKFQTLTNPINMIVRIASETVPGIFLWLDDKPELRLFFEVSLEDIYHGEVQNHPIIKLTKPPTQPTITGTSKLFNTLTFERCTLFSTQTQSDYKNNIVLYTIYLQPTIIWLDNSIEEIENKIDFVELFDTRLGGFFQIPALKAERNTILEVDGSIEEFNKPIAIWKFYSAEQDWVNLGTSGYQLRLSSDVTYSSSATTGKGINSITKLSLKPQKESTFKECETIIHKLHSLFTIFSLEDFTVQAQSYTSGSVSTIKGWELGNYGNTFVSPLNHQILVDFSNSCTFQKACKGWFESSEGVDMSRWLFGQAIRETSDGIVRFVSVVQAFEVLGREIVESKKQISKSDMKIAIEAIELSLKAENIDDQFIKRTKQLIRSSNRSSFQDVLKEMILPVAKIIMPGNEDYILEFCKKVAEARNNIVHMTKDSKKLETSFREVHKISLLLCFWYAVIQANMLGLPLDRALKFLANNRNARHGLPNEILENL